MKKIFLSILLVATVVSCGLFMHVHHANAAFNPNLLIDDTVFNDINSMNAAQIDSWLNAYFPNSCISPNSGFLAKVPNGYSPSAGFTYGAFGTAGQVIATAAQVYGLNPQVLLVTLQKEQSLVAGGSGFCNNGDENKYAAAVGYGCPDGGTVYNWSGISLYMRSGVEHTTTGPTCVNSASKAGFSQQLIRAAWLLKFGQQRSLGNVNWAVITGNWDNSDDPPTCYGGPMTQGTLKRCQNGAATFYDGYTTIDGSATHMDTGATAALYWYTPHFGGNQNFVSIFEGWFGSTISSLYYACHGYTNINGALGGGHVIKRNIFGIGKADNLALSFLNNTGSACIETHTWANNNYQTWWQNLATNHPVVNPADDEVISADLNGDGVSELLLIKLRNSGSGKIEVHQWSSSLQAWASNLATNYPAVDPTHYRVIAADLNGDGKDELILIDYTDGASGKIEIFPWAPGYQSFSAYIATNYPSVIPGDYEIIAANTASDGGPIDKLILVKYRGGASGRIEINTWNPGERSWYSNIATNHPAVDPADDQVISANITGVGKDQLLLVKYRNSRSGKIEIHAWGTQEQSWYNNLATNLPTISP